MGSPHDESDMSGVHVAVFGVYASRGAARVALDALKSTGFRSTDVSILHPLAAAAAADGDGQAMDGYVGWLAGVGRLMVPGAGSCIVAGPIVGALAAMGEGGALGRPSAALVGMGLAVSDAAEYEDRVLAGGILVSAHAEDPASAMNAKEILRRTGADHMVATPDADANRVSSSQVG